MDVSEVRLRNYNVLMRQFRERGLDRGEPERGSLNRFGGFTGISPRYLSHVNNGRKHLGPEACRKIETAFRLPHGWMDHDHLGGTAPSSKPEREFLELALRLFRESPVEAQSVLMRYMGERMIASAERLRNSQEADREPSQQQKQRRRPTATRATTR